MPNAAPTVHPAVSAASVAAPQQLIAQAIAHHHAGRLDQAANLYRQILQLHPCHADALHLLGMTEFQSGRSRNAIFLIRRAIALHPGAASYRSNLGNIWQSLHQHEAAVAEYRAAIALQPNLVQAHVNLANNLRKLDRFPDSIAAAEHALRLDPGCAEAWESLGNAHLEQHQPLAAIPHYHRAIALKPTFALAHHNLGWALRSLGRVAEARASYARALEYDPLNADIQFNAAVAALLHADFAAGWPAFESRWKASRHDSPVRRCDAPRWNGQPLAAGRLLLWSEQGVGDEVMFTSLVPDALHAAHVPVRLECDPRLQPLFARSFPTVEIVSTTAPRHDTELQIAAHLPIGSLPHLFRPTGASFARSKPFLVPDSDLRSRLRDQYADGRRLIGLAWYTKNLHQGGRRSIGLQTLAPLLHAPHTRFISLQYGDPDELQLQAANASVPLTFDNSIDQLKNLDAFAAQIASLDLVITIDNSTAHLAGALGVPTWLLLPFAPDWRWLEHGDTSPWYPTLRLFRQSPPGDWTSVVNRVARALGETSPGSTTALLP